MPEQRTVPHFAVTTITGKTVRYVDVWQHAPLVLVVLPATPSEEDGEYLARFREEADALSAYAAAIVITRDVIDGLPPPTVVIADQWGEIVFTATGEIRALPVGTAIGEWLRYLEHRCPECEGESR